MKSPAFLLHTPLQWLNDEAQLQYGEVLVTLLTPLKWCMEKCMEIWRSACYTSYTTEVVYGEVYGNHEEPKAALLTPLSVVS